MKPARGAKAVTLALSATATVGLAGLFAEQDEAVTTSAPATPSPSTESTVATTTASSTATSTATLADGVFLGEPDTNRWGTVQVQIVVSGGVVTDVQVLSYPDDDRRSENINEHALPALIDEALEAQDADIDSVSGATYTWQSYSVSLQSALDAAAAAA